MVYYDLQNIQKRGCRFFEWINCDAPEWAREIIIELVKPKKVLQIENIELRNLNTMEQFLMR